MAVKFPSGADAKAFWKDEYFKPRRIAWQRAHATYFPEQTTMESWINIRPLMGMGEDTDNTCAYAFCILRAEKETPVSFSLGSDDGYVLFVNGQREGEAKRGLLRLNCLDGNYHGT